ncbi:MAG: hypothetical protein K6F07_02155 [Bacilli bacterium]|nr:hypothetical protein [Bacilli bacterium]
MQFGKLAPLFLFSLALSSCGPNTPYGNYAFQMGKTSSSHIAVSMTLGKEEVKQENEVLGKSMTFTIEGKMGADGNEDEENFDVMDFLSSGLHANGYYSIGEKVKDDIKKLKIGINIKALEELFEIPITIGSDVVEEVVYSEISSKNVALYIPVSVDDLKFQLYWYGFDVRYEGTGDERHIVLKDSTPHPVSTHPTADEVKEVNKTYPADHEGTYFRDYHTLTLKLTKQ